LANGSTIIHVPHPGRSSQEAMTISADQAVATSQIDHDIQPEVISW